MSISRAGYARRATWPSRSRRPTPRCRRPIASTSSTRSRSTIPARRSRSSTRPCDGAHPRHRQGVQEQECRPVRADDRRRVRRCGAVRARAPHRRARAGLVRPALRHESRGRAVHRISRRLCLQGDHPAQGAGRRCRRHRRLRRPAARAAARRRDSHRGETMTIPATTALKAKLAERRALLVPGVPNALSALIAADLGYEAVYVTGAGVTNMNLGMPDLGLITLSELAEHVRAIREMVDLPIIVDADTGFGNAVNVYRTVKVLEHAGASAIQLEDQVFPKKCG